MAAMVLAGSDVACHMARISISDIYIYISTHNMQVGWVGSLCVMKHGGQIT